MQTVGPSTFAKRRRSRPTLHPVGAAGRKPSGVAYALQTPATQLWPAEQALPQPPQLLGSSNGFAQ
jgi:hypothetical protein